jgi:hypothetical protein
MKSFVERHRGVWSRQIFQSAILGAVLFLGAIVVNYFATRYVTARASAPVTDIILSNVRVYDVDGIIVYGALALALFASIITLYHPKRIPFVLKSVGLFIVIRSIFISLTHLGPFSPGVMIEPTRILNFLGITTTADLFFSGHTGMPFLLALIYWDKKPLRWIFLATSVLFAVSVLLGHLHYSIDVFAAFFITYSIFKLAQFLFPRDWQRSRE